MIVRTGNNTRGEEEKNTNFEHELHEFGIKLLRSAIMTDLILPEESYKLMGLCMEVHQELGLGFKEIVYKDALEFELTKNNIYFRREKRFDIIYKGYILPHSYAADFIVYDRIVLEVKATSIIVNNFVKQTINYLKASGLQLVIIANFGEKSFVSKRVVF